MIIDVKSNQSFETNQLLTLKLRTKKALFVLVTQKPVFTMIKLQQ